MEGGNVAKAGGWSGNMPAANSGVIHDDERDGRVVAMSETPVAVVSTTVGGDFEVVRHFVRKFCGVSGPIVDGGTWASLVSYVQGRFP